LLKWADKELWRWGEYQQRFLESSAIGYKNSTIEAGLMDGTCVPGQNYGAIVPLTDMPEGVQKTERALQLIGAEWYKFAVSRYVEQKKTSGGWVFTKLDRLHHRFEVAYLIQNQHI